MNLQNLLNNWNIKCDIETIFSMYNESHRSYHNLKHLTDLISQINENKSKYTNTEYEKLIITSLFHDCVYDPMKSDNEHRSAEFFESCCKEITSDIKDIKQMIIDTKEHKSNTSLSESFNKYDINIVERSYDELLEWEEGISEEYSGYGKENYTEGRIKFLESLLDKHINNTENLLKLIEYVKLK